VKETFDWTQQTIKLLSQLLGVISETITTWNRFNSSDKDIGSFSGINSSLVVSQFRIPLSLCAIKKTFQTLKGLQQRFLLLDKSCRDKAQTVSKSYFLMFTTTPSLVK
jgi:hypothetical protein